MLSAKVNHCCSRDARKYRQSPFHRASWKMYEAETLVSMKMINDSVEVDYSMSSTNQKKLFEIVFFFDIRSSFIHLHFDLWNSREQCKMPSQMQ